MMMMMAVHRCIVSFSSTSRRSKPSAMMPLLLSLVLLCCRLTPFVQSFVPSKVTFSIGRQLNHPLVVVRGSLDYEFIPPESTATAPYNSNLPSIYPPDTPAGLRGEAVRSSLTSGRCIAWNFSHHQLQQGWIQVEGKGTLDFLNNKLSQTVGSSINSFTEACLLSAKGKVVDVVGVAVESPTKAFLLTSPGHASSTLFERLDPLIFPMDQVTLTEYEPSIITVVSTKIEDVQEAIAKYVLPLVSNDDSTTIELSNISTCTFVSDDLVILPHGVLPTCAGVGYSLVFTNDKLATGVWQALTGDQHPDGPIGIGELEYETLRIQAGLPAYGSEYGNIDNENSQMTLPGPLELHLESLLDMDKGCYLGQEGVASIVKNIRGPPRILYSVVFDDESNLYDDSDSDNLTTLPKVGQELYVLGSNEEIAVGTITSLAEPSGTGDAFIVGLALVRRADSILKQMKSMDLNVGDDSQQSDSNSGMIAPPPLDPLDGLEVIVGGTFTVGKLQMIPSRRYRLGQIMFLEESENGFVPPDEEGSVVGVLNPNEMTLPVEAESDKDTEDDLEKARQEAEKAKAEAEAAAAEAKRKEEKMEMLKKRAEAAMARRKKKKT